MQSGPTPPSTLQMKIVSIALGLLAASSSCLADQLDSIKAAGMLRCGVGAGYKPFSYAQDPRTRKLVGYDVDICEAVAAGLGVKPELVFITTSTRVTDLQQGRTDLALAAISHTAERAKIVDFSVTYMVTGARIAVLANHGAKSFADLAGKRFSVTEGANFEVKLPKVIERPQLQVFQSPAAAFLALEQGKVDGMGGDETTLRGLIGSDRDRFRVLDEPVDQQHLGPAVRKGEARLLAEVNRTLMDLEQSGRAAEMFERWFGSQSELRMTRKFKFAPHQPR